MSEHSEAYELASTLFNAFHIDYDSLTAAKLKESGIVIRTGHLTNTQGIEGRYEKDGRMARQRLSLGKQGLYYFTTTYTNRGGEVVHRQVSPNSNNNLDELRTSVFKLAFDSTSDSSGFSD